MFRIGPAIGTVRQVDQLRAALGYYRVVLEFLFKFRCEPKGRATAFWQGINFRRTATVNRFGALD